MRYRGRHRYVIPGRTHIGLGALGGALLLVLVIALCTGITLLVNLEWW